MSEEGTAKDPRALASALTKLAVGENIVVQNFPVNAAARMSKIVLGGREFSVLRIADGYRVWRTK